MSAQVIREYLSLLGFSHLESKLYTALVQQGPMSILQAARASGIERTMVYRMVEDLRKKGLIEVQLAFKSTLIQAVSVQHLKRLADQKIDEAGAVKDGFDRFSQEIETLHHAYLATKVLYFRGTDGIKQMQWNTLGAKKEMKSYVSRAFQETIGQKFLESYAAKWRELRIQYYELKSETFESTIDPNKKLYPVDLGPKYKWQIVPNSIVDITHNMDIYNDVVSVYYWQENEIFGIEIHNQVIAQMQKSIFDTLWRLTKTVPLV